MPNRYAGVRALATHPAFSRKHVALLCRLCNEFTSTRVAAYDQHFREHKPGEEQARRWLSHNAYLRYAKRDGWTLNDRDLKDIAERKQRAADRRDRQAKLKREDPTAYALSKYLGIEIS